MCDTSKTHDEPTVDTAGRFIPGLLPAVMASCRDAIIACSIDGRIEAWNLGAAETYGYRDSEAIGRSIETLIPKERLDELKRLQRAAREGRTVGHYDTVRLRRSGSAFPAAVCGFPLRAEDGQLVGFATIERDISDRVRINDALRTALRRAEEASEAKSRFLANASHELRTPMNAIVGMTALALEEDLSPELRDYLETIQSSADSMLHLVNDVLDLSKFESESFELEEAVFDPRELVEGAVRVLSSAAHAKGLELVCHVAPQTPPAVVGDSVRLRQALTNLISNAVKFTAAGQVVVDVTPLSVEAHRCKLRFEVSDTGIGISSEDQQRVFAPFTQVDGATSRRYTGTGLGLTITQHLIDSFGGQLSLKSEPGEGSTFAFDLTFPLADESHDEVERATTRRLRGLSVLVIDDNHASRNALVEQLIDWGMDATAVESGSEGLRRLAEAEAEGRPFNLAVVDALMPGVDGFSVAEQIVSADHIKAKPILMASTTDRLEFSRRCAEAGAAAFVQKPISQSQLLSAVAQASGAASLDKADRAGLFARPRVEPMRVLLVEDTPANRKVVQRVLDKRGHTVEVAVNGREAVDAFRQSEYDVVLMDVQMPIMDGLQATEAIREIERGRSREPTPLIAMTAHSMRGDRERCLRAGMNAYLGKPLDLERLIEAVEAHAGGFVERDIGELGGAPTAKGGLHEGAPADSVGEGLDATGDAADLTAALRRLRGDRGLLVDMIAFFLDDAPVLLRTIDESIEADELETLQRAAHSMKGLTATFDAHAAQAAARDLEHAARDGELEAVPKFRERLSAEVDRLRTELERFRDSSTTA
ncbi:response regulator [Botrimarina sp.]|uniref:response regulator n=1 Tax=Botrimarina sp. TaxID=2795802 RepID=UPI0032EDEE36